MSFCYSRIQDDGELGYEIAQLTELSVAKGMECLDVIRACGKSTDRAPVAPECLLSYNRRIDVRQCVATLVGHSVNVEHSAGISLSSQRDKIPPTTDNKIWHCLICDVLECLRCLYKQMRASQKCDKRARTKRFKKMSTTKMRQRVYPLLLIFRECLPFAAQEWQLIEIGINFA
jgi:hypothetical protein